MTLDLFIVLERQEVDQGLQETSLDDRGLVHGMDGHIAGTCSGGKDEREVRGLKKTKERSQTVSLDNFQLVLLWIEGKLCALGRRKFGLTVACQVPQGKGGLALNLEARAIHKLNKILNELRLALGQFLPIRA